MISRATEGRKKVANLFSFEVKEIDNDQKQWLLAFDNILFWSNYCTKYPVCQSINSIT